VRETLKVLEVDFGEHSVLGNARSFDGFLWLRRLKVLLDMLVCIYVVEQKLVDILPDGLAFTGDSYNDEYIQDPAYYET
jgi:hypothetical protein